MTDEALDRALENGATVRRAVKLNGRSYGVNDKVSAGAVAKVPRKNLSALLFNGVLVENRSRPLRIKRRQQTPA